MNDKVLITITGLQNEISEDDSIQTIQQGKHKFMADKHVIFYEELPEQESGLDPVPVKNIVKISKNTVTISKHGGTSMDMVFQKDHHHTCIYETPLGSFHVNIITTKLDIQETEDSVNVEINYDLEINYNHISDCTVSMDIQSI